MESVDIWKSKNSEEMEEWFLSAISEDNLNLKEVFGLLNYLIKSDKTAQFTGLAELLQDELQTREMPKEGMTLLTIRSVVLGADPSFRAVARKTADAVLHSRLGTVCIKNSGFDANLPIDVCMDRLNLLIALEKGRFCYDKTWGFGVVKRVDDFYEKVAIDFTGKTGHQLSFNYAAETLELIGDDHLLAMNHADPEGLAELIKKDPAEAVKIALRSYGSMPAPILSEKFIDVLMPEANWKSFWATARKKLKADPLVEVPEKRNDSIVLLASEKLYDESWFNELGVERDVKTILTLMQEILEKVPLDELSDSARSIIAGRIKFVLAACNTVDRCHLVVALLIAKEMGFSEEDVSAAAFVKSLSDPTLLSNILNSLPVREVGELREYLVEVYPDEVFDILCACLQELRSGVLNDTIVHLASMDKDRFMTVAKELINGEVLSFDLVFWFSKNSSTVVEWGVSSSFGIMMLLFDAMGRRGDDVTVAAINQLKGLLERGEWFKEILGELTEEQRSDVVIRLKYSKDWDEGSRRSVMARAIKAFPHLQSLFVESDDSASDEPQGNFTSLRSYRERSDQLQRLVNDEIPRNSKDIGIARSYGDLRENAEYDAARHEQGLLMKRKTELESDLARVAATDFVGLPVDKAGIGTFIVVKRSDGKTMSYNILGEWDRDEELNIISSKSRMAELVSGAKAGEERVLPTEDGDMPCIVESVEGLSDEIMTWAARQ